MTYPPTLVLVIRGWYQLQFRMYQVPCALLLTSLLAPSAPLPFPARTPPHWPQLLQGPLWGLVLLDPLPAQCSMEDTSISLPLEDMAWRKL